MGLFQSKQKKAQGIFQNGLEFFQQDDLVSAFDCFQKALALGCTDAALQCASMIYSGVKNGKQMQYWEYPEDARELDAMPYLEKGAKMGCKECMLLLAQALDGSLKSSIKQDKKTAFRWFLAAEEAGNKEATSYVAHAYYEGIGTDKNPKVALYYCKKGAADGDNFCRVLYGIFLQEGTYVPQDHKAAFELFTKAAEDDSPSGTRRLGLCYEKGFGTDVNYISAAKWYQTSIDLENEEAQKSLDAMLRSVTEQKTEQAYTFLALCWSRRLYGYPRDLEKAWNYAFLALQSRYADTPAETQPSAEDVDSRAAEYFENGRRLEKAGKDYLSALNAYKQAAGMGHTEAAIRARRLLEKTGQPDKNGEIARLAAAYGDPFLSKNIPVLLARVKNRDELALEYFAEELHSKDPLLPIVKAVLAQHYLQRFLADNEDTEAAFLTFEHWDHTWEERIPESVRPVAEENGFWQYSVATTSDVGLRAAQAAIDSGIVKAKKYFSWREYQDRPENRYDPKDVLLEKLVKDSLIEQIQLALSLYEAAEEYYMKPINIEHDAIKRYRKSGDLTQFKFELHTASTGELQSLLRDLTPDGVTPSEALNYRSIYD